VEETHATPPHTDVSPVAVAPPPPAATQRNVAILLGAVALAAVSKLAVPRLLRLLSRPNVPALTPFPWVGAPLTTRSTREAVWPKVHSTAWSRTSCVCCSFVPFRLDSRHSTHTSAAMLSAFGSTCIRSTGSGEQLNDVRVRVCVCARVRVCVSLHRPRSTMPGRRPSAYCSLTAPKPLWPRRHLTRCCTWTRTVPRPPHPVSLKHNFDHSRSPQVQQVRRLPPGLLSPTTSAAHPLVGVTRPCGPTSYWSASAHSCPCRCPKVT
jgi:hypothetical protein